MVRFHKKLFPQSKSSITRETLIKMAVRIAFVILGSTALSYLHLMSILETQTIKQLDKYIVERGQRESNIFTLAEDNHAVLEQEIKRRLEEWEDYDPQAEFDQRFVRSHDGVIRNQPEKFDRSRQAGVYIGKNVELTPEIRRRVLIFYDLVISFGMAWRSRFQNTYINTPENIGIMYWPEVPWAENTTSDLYIPNEDSFWITNSQHNPSRQTVCTGLSYDRIARDWTISCGTPVDIAGKQVATIGHDIVLNELLERTLQDRLPGTYNLIFRSDGRLIAHPDKMDEIKNKQGKFEITQSQDLHLIRIFELVKHLESGQVVVKNDQDQEYLAVAKLETPDWYFVTVFPKSILAEVAFKNARFVLILGGISLIFEIVILLFVLRQQVAEPLSQLMVATEQIATGDFNINLDIKRSDELGQLASSFNTMAGEVQAREVRLKQAQIALKRTDKLKDEFLANTSHELRTPLNGIIGIAESLIDGTTGQLTSATLSNLRMIVSSGRRLANLVNDILDFSKLKHKTLELQLKPVGLREVVEVVITLSQPLIDQKKLQIHNKISPLLPAVIADENRLQQIFHNLIGNALKFTDSGKIEITAQAISNSASQQLQITVSDTGIGIPEDKLERIFESFEQADGSTARIYGGTGLGLAITKQLIELQGGEIWVESTLNEGSQFHFTLPISLDLESHSSNTSILSLRDHFSSSVVMSSAVSVYSEDRFTESEEQVIEEISSTLIQDQQQVYKILVVDDEPVNRQVLVNHLSLYQYEITEAASGYEALDLLRNGLKPDLILLDVMMPRMTGYEVTRKVREIWQPNELPIVLLTAKNQVSDLVIGLQAGANDYVTKPITKSELIARITTHCTQAATFLENARLYLELQASEARERERSMQLEQSLEQLKNVQLQMIQAEKMASIGQLVAGVGHEINNPISFILGNISYAETSVKDLIDLILIYQDKYPQPCLEIVEKIEKIDLSYLIEDLPQVMASLKMGAERIRQISIALRTFSRRDTDQKVEFNLHEGIESTLMILKHRLQGNSKRPEITIIKNYGDLPPINCYPGQLNQVFLNLVANAIDALDDAMEDRAYREHYNSPQKISIHTELSQDEQWAIIRIKDNGMGMIESVKQKIFEHLFTTKPVGKGTGIGLSISHQIIVEKHGGKLSCVSSWGEGSEFIIEIPVE
ncbi:ATP-binding protein [Planktothrix pseudagardhii]|uniref:Circadian input-output histidine kinase CikA n=1 Tax=Planktothrix pseudagardhii TaxID=132604 RepID=A0A9W4D866_9CYAN|nr:ATP-binding protein [Planktothrix pseudagardhii]CAD5978840.1 Histidine protein kinase NIK1 [Planktothrix pseudagardhii]